MQSARSDRNLAVPSCICFRFITRFNTDSVILAPCVRIRFHHEDLQCIMYTVSHSLRFTPLRLAIHFFFDYFSEFQGLFEDDSNVCQIAI